MKGEDTPQATRPYMRRNLYYKGIRKKKRNRVEGQ